MTVLTLRRGMRLMLPSGLEVVLVSRTGSEWTCAYVEQVRGEVVFTGNWLRRFCILV